MLDVVTVGSCVRDVFVDTGVAEKERKICYPVGSKILIKKLIFSTGGGGANTAVSLSRLGLRAGYLGKVGDDENGNAILALLKKEKVKFLGVRGKEKSGYSVILDSTKHNRTILTYKGANDNLKFSEVKKGKLKTRWFYFSSMMQDSFKTQEKLAKFAKRNNIRVAYNPSSYLTKKGSRFLKNILSRTYILILNREEARMLVPKGNLFKGLCKLGPKVACVTNGKKEMHVYDGKYLYKGKPHNIGAKERTGAGDAFASSFLAGFIKRNDIEFAMQLGVANAESVIGYYGSMNKLLSWKEAVKVINKKPIKVKVLK